jgi:large subunit ribosomal protein L21
MVGTPSVSGILVKATVVGHVKGPKVISFKYRPKKRIRVKGGHRHQYTRLRVDFIGRPDEERKREKAAAPAPKEETAAAPKTPAKKKSTAKTAAPKKPAAPKKTTKK